ncbi:MAG: hypothetical protein HQ582_00915 [Planctomycetes bacterium]|nr:hypothetical protein [Planctomycetota bacterium]
MSKRTATLRIRCILTAATVLLTARAAPGRTALVGQNWHPGFVFHDAGGWRVIADVTPGQHRSSGEGRLGQAAECYVAPGALIPDADVQR